MTNDAVAAAGPLAEKFAAPTGRWFGIAMIVFAAGLSVVLVIDDPNDGLRAASGLAALSLASWVVLIRPEVSLHSNGVLIRNMLRDAFVPSAGIRRCAVLQTLQIATDDRTYYGLGVIKSGRKRMRERAGSGFAGMFGFHREFEEAPKAYKYADTADVGAYTDYVEDRIRRAAHDAAAQRDTAEGDAEPVVVTAWQPVAAVVLAVVLGVLTFV